MLLSECEPFTFAPPSGGITQLVGYLRKGHGLSQCLWWEWRYFHYATHNSDLADWLADAGRGVCARVTQDWALGVRDICHPPKPALNTHIRRLTVSTQAAVALMIHSSSARSIPADRKRRLFQITRSFLQFAHDGIVAAAAEGLQVQLDLPDRSVALRIDESGIVQGMSPILDELPTLSKHWREKAPLLGGLGSGPDAPELCELLLVLALLPTSLIAKHKWLRT